MAFRFAAAQDFKDSSALETISQDWLMKQGQEFEFLSLSSINILDGSDKSELHYPRGECSSDDPWMCCDVIYGYR